MATVQGLGRKIRVGEELRSVVGTMKGLAAVSIHEYEEAVEALREYTETIELGMQILFAARPEAVPRRRRAAGRAGAVVIGTDQGLCGPLNRDIARAAVRWFSEEEVPPGDRVVASLGVRAARELELAGSQVDHRPMLPESVESIAAAVEDLLPMIDEWRASRGVSRVVIIFHHPVRRTQRTVRVFQVLPPDARRFASIAGRRWPTRMLPGFPHPWIELLRGLVRQDLFIALYRAIAEAKAAEHGARLAAMQAAEQNIDERLAELRTDYRQLRQAEITAGLLDVVSGYEALRGR